MFRARYGNVYAGDERWRGIDVTGSETYQWRAGSTSVANPPYFEGMELTPAPVADIVEAKPLATLGDSITTDTISPPCRINAHRPAAPYLQDHQSTRQDFNSYVTRRRTQQVQKFEHAYRRQTVLH